MFSVDSTIALSLELKRILLRAMLRHGPAILSGWLVFAAKHTWAPDRLDALAVAQLKAILEHGSFSTTGKGPERVLDGWAQTPPRRNWRLSVLYFIAWILALSNSEQGAAEPTAWMKPPAWTGNFWGPPATRARAAGQLPPLPVSPAMTRW